MSEPDTEIDLCGQPEESPKLGNHWARRKADQVAQDTARETDTTAETIDELFGWDQRVRKKKQQIHYRGRTELVKLARVTMLL